MSLLNLFLALLTSSIITFILKYIFTKFSFFDAINHRSVHKSKATKRQKDKSNKSVKVEESLEKNTRSIVLSKVASIFP